MHVMRAMDGAYCELNLSQPVLSRVQARDSPADGLFHGRFQPSAEFSVGAAIAWIRVLQSATLSNPPRCGVAFLSGGLDSITSTSLSVPNDPSVLY